MDDSLGKIIKDLRQQIRELEDDRMKSIREASSDLTTARILHTYLTRLSTLQAEMVANFANLKNEVANL